VVSPALPREEPQLGLLDPLAPESTYGWISYGGKTYYFGYQGRPAVYSTYNTIDPCTRNILE
jgi:hypothetical protein